MNKHHLESFVRLLTLTVAFIAMTSCDRTAKNPGADGPSEKFVGNWEGQTKPIGGQGLIHVVMDLRKDSSFLMIVEAKENAHALNPYPTIDQIEFTGKWVVADENTIRLDGKIDHFIRQQMIGNAAQHGFLPDDENGISKTQFVPLPFEESPTLNIQQDGRLYLGYTSFSGRKPNESSDSILSKYSRMVNHLHLMHASE